MVTITSLILSRIRQTISIRFERLDRLKNVDSGRVLVMPQGKANAAWQNHSPPSFGATNALKKLFAKLLVSDYKVRLK